MGITLYVVGCCYAMIIGTKYGPTIEEYVWGGGPKRMCFCGMVLACLEWMTGLYLAQIKCI